ncbi:hypothetical protein [Streptomyces sp. NPDC021969]|uniref:hypothetical protein n=1 Tax=unclassified Streptomyces TaxID=2593676 RepID=UPI0034059F7B
MTSGARICAGPVFPADAEVFAEAGEPGAAGLLLGHGLAVHLVIGPGLRGSAYGGDGALLAVVA